MPCAPPAPQQDSLLGVTWSLSSAGAVARKSAGSACNHGGNICGSEQAVCREGAPSATSKCGAIILPNRVCLCENCGRWCAHHCGGCVCTVLLGNGWHRIPGDEPMPCFHGGTAQHYGGWGSSPGPEPQIDMVPFCCSKFTTVEVPIAHTARHTPTDLHKPVLSTDPIPENRTYHSVHR